jgi:hypothetical protein
MYIEPEDDDAPPIEKIDNRKKPQKEEPENTVEEKEEEDDESESVTSKSGIAIDTSEITKNVKIKLAKNNKRANINTRKRNIVKSKAKKDIRDAVKSF